MDANKFVPVAQIQQVTPITALRDAIRTQMREGGVPQKRKLITVALADDKTLELEVRALASGAVWKLQSQGFVVGPDGKRVVDREKFYPLLVAAAYFIPGTDERVWPAGQEDEILSFDSAIVDSMAAEALEISGWTADKDKELEGNSERAVSSDSSSSSPTS